MHLQTLLFITSAALGLLGSIVLAFSLDCPLLTLRTHAEALDVTVDALASSGNVPVFVGFDEHYKRSFAVGNRRVKLGCGLLVLAFLSQLVGTFLPSPPPPPAPTAQNAPFSS